MTIAPVSAPPGRLRLTAASAPPGAAPLPQDSFVPSPPREDLLPAAPVQRTPRRRKLTAALALGLVGVGVAGGVAAVPGPAAPVSYVCSAGNVQTGTTREPSLIQSLLNRTQGTELTPRARMIMACENVQNPSQLQHPRHRADLAWEALVANMGGDVQDLRDRSLGGFVTAWPYGQAMAASLDRAKLSGDYSEFQRMVTKFEDFKDARGAYAPGTHGGERFYDDNAWLGLVFIQAHQQVRDPALQAEYLGKAQEIFSFLETGVSPEGGVLWVENNERPTFNTCSMGPTLELALRLHQATGKQEYLDLALRMDAFMDRNLREPSGLYIDNVTTDLKQREGFVFSYNQGTPIGAKVLLHRITGDARYLAQARETAEASVRHFQEGDRLWKQAPAFNAIYFRNLVQLDPAYRGFMDRYLEQAWSQALDSRTGLLQQGGIASYEADWRTMIDQAGLVQLYALQDWPAAEVAKVS